MADIFNPVPLGRANTGSASIFTGGLGALSYLQNTDKLAEAARQRAALAAQRQKDQEYKDFMSRVKLSDEGGVHYLPLLQGEAQKTYASMEALATNPQLSRYDRGLQQQQQQDQYNRMAKASLKNDQYVADLARRVTADKRFDTDKTTRLLHDTMYQQGEDGQQRIISPLDYDPQRADAAVNTGNEHLNGVEVFKTYLRGSHPDAVTNERQALPGGKGFRNVASSDVYELTKDGKIAYDPHTNLPVVKATPQALQYFDSDPVNRQYLDGFELQHQKSLQAAVEKMQNYQQLTPEEADAVELEKSPAGRRMELFKRGLMEQGYGRQSTTILAKAAPRPRAGSSKGPKSTQEGVTSFVPGVLGGEGGYGGAQGITHYGASDPLKRRNTSTGKVEDYTANVTHRDYLVSAGGKMTHVTNNSSPQQLAYQSPVVLLRKPNGTAVFPTDPAIISATQRGDMKPLEAWTRKERAKDASLRPAYYMGAVPKANADLNVGSADDVFQQLKSKEDAYRKAYTEGTSALASAVGDDPEEKKRLQLASLFSGGGKAPRFYSDAELHEQARKLYSNKNATLYVPYEGEEKLKIDANTDYALRKPERRKQMQDYLAGIDQRTRPGAEDRASATAGRGPLAGLLPTSAPAKKATTTPAPTANPHGFKFKK